MASISMQDMQQQDSIRKLNELHQQMMNDGYDNNNISTELLTHLGGIDTILQYCLSDECLPLTDSQIQNIHDKISHHYIESQESKEMKYDSNNNMENIEKKQILTLDPNNNYLNKLFTFNKALIIRQVIFSKFVTCILLLIMCYLVLQIIIIALPDIIMIIGLIIVIIWASFMILTLNRKAVNLTLRTFEYVLLTLCCFTVLIRNHQQVIYIDFGLKQVMESSLSLYRF